MTRRYAPCPAPVPVPAGAGVPFLDNACMSVWQVSGPGADQIANCGIHRAVFARTFHDCGAGILNCIAIFIERDETSISTAHITDSVSRVTNSMFVIRQGSLLDASQGRRVPTMPAQKQSPQVRHVSPQNRKEFRVRAARPGKALPDGRNPGIRSGHGYPLLDLRLARRKLPKGVPHETLCRLGVAGTPRPAAAGRQSAIKGWPRIS